MNQISDTNQDDTVNNLQRQAFTIALSESELASEKAKLRSFMHQVPAVSTLPTRSNKSIVSPFIPSPIAHFLRWGSAVAAVLVIGVTTVSAEFALPGDFLYTIKREVNDRAITSFAFSDEAKAHANITLAERRLEEVGQVLLTEEPNTETQDTLEEVAVDISNNIEIAQSYITEAKIHTKTTPANEEDDDVSVRLTATVEAHDAALDTIVQRNPTIANAAEDVIEVINETVAETEITSDEADPEFVEARHNAIEHVEALFKIDIPETPIKPITPSPTASATSSTSTSTPILQP